MSMMISSLAFDYYDIFGDDTEDEKEASEENKDSGVSERNIVFVSDVAYYNREEAMYCFPVGTRDEIVEVSVFDGMIVTDKVVLRIPEDENVVIYRNGAEYEIEDNSISKTGSYVINYTQNGAVTQLMSFTIVYKQTGKIESYRMPSNFVVNRILKDGEEIALTRTSVDFTEEGVFSVEYECTPTGVEYELNVTIDHTAPTLKLEAVKNGSANGPVDISDLEKDARIIIKRNGKIVEDEDTVLSKSGNYQIVVADLAGNTNTYQFTIQVYFNTNSIVLFVIIILGIIALVFYIYKSRTGLKVR